MVRVLNSLERREVEHGGRTGNGKSAHAEGAEEERKVAEEDRQQQQP
jgi:hypothetical protein